MPYALGRRPRGHDPRIPQLHQMAARLATLEPVPEAVDYTTKLPESVGMYLNDSLGICTSAAYMHAIQVWSSWTNPDGLVITEPDSDALALYSATGGYVLGHPETDQGAEEQAVLKYLLTTGAPTGPAGATRHRLRAFYEIDPRNLADIRRAIHDCGVVYIGIDMPTYIMEETPALWDYPGGPGADTSIAGGHAIILSAYDADSFTLISWGQKFRMSNAFFGRYTEEAYALVDFEWLAATGKTPLGLSISELEALMAPLRIASTA